VAKPRAPLRPLRLTGHRSDGRPNIDLPRLPKQAPRVVAPNRPGPTEGNGLDSPRADLHIALIVPDRKTADLLRNKVRIVRPPLWKGKLFLHLIPQDQRHKYRDIDMTTLLALIDTGLIDAKTAEIAAPDEITIGYPSGDTS
jgi:hypothetical protein